MRFSSRRPLAAAFARNAAPAFFSFSATTPHEIAPAAGFFGLTVCMSTLIVRFRDAVGQTGLTISRSDSLSAKSFSDWLMATPRAYKLLLLVGSQGPRRARPQIRCKAMLTVRLLGLS